MRTQTENERRADQAEWLSLQDMGYQFKREQKKYMRGLVKTARFLVTHSEFYRKNRKR